jgi:hypothetical protein
MNHLCCYEILDDRDESHLPGEKLPGGVPTLVGISPPYALSSRSNAYERRI